LYYQDPKRLRWLPDNVKAAKMDALPQYHALVTNSESAKRKLLGAFSYLGASGTSVNIIRDPILSDQHIPFGSKASLVLSIAPFHRTSMGGTHDPALQAYKNFIARDGSRAWKLVCVGDIHTLDDLSYLNALRYQGAAWDVRFMVRPSRLQRVELYARAKLSIYPGDLGSGLEGEDWTRIPSRNEVGDAIVRGCIPVAYLRTLEAETCEYLGVPFLFYSAEELEEQLYFAASFAHEPTFVANLQSRAESLSLNEYTAAWTELISGPAT
jgi:hypothetical protein